MLRPKGLKTENSADLVWLWVGLLVFVVIASFSISAKAQNSRCGNFSVIENKITGPKYNEMKIGTGISGDRKMVLFVNPTTGSYTMIVRIGSHMSCIAGAGTDWKFHKPQKKRKQGRGS